MSVFPSVFFCDFNIFFSFPQSCSGSLARLFFSYCTKKITMLRRAARSLLLLRRSTGGPAAVSHA